MTLAASDSNSAELERRVAERTADLNELLGHVAGCWDEERRVLARRLHDSLGASMTALTMHLAMLSQQLPPDGPLQERSAQMKQLLMGIIGNNRDMQRSLWNDKLEFLGLKAALLDLVARFDAEQRMTVALRLVDEEPGYPRELGLALLRCAEEGLRNIAAHAQASAVEMTLADDGHWLTLVVRDDGIGPGIADMAPPSCHGLRLLRARVANLGGSLRVDPDHGRGTVLRVMLPRSGLSAA